MIDLDAIEEAPYFRRPGNVQLKSAIIVLIAEVRWWYQMRKGEEVISFSLRERNTRLRTEVQRLQTEITKLREVE